MKTKTTITGIALGIVMLLAGVQGAWAQNANTCKGTVYLKAPDNWSAAYIGGKNVNNVKAMTLNEDGYYQYNLANLGITDNQNPGFAIGNMPTGTGLQIISGSRFAFDAQNGNDTNWPTNNATLRCPGEGHAVYVTDNPTTPGYTKTGDYPPDAKHFYVLVPDEKEWQSDDLMISYTNARGVKVDTAMTPASLYCGWFEMVFISKAPSDAILYLKNTPDVKLGIDGTWDDDGVADPIDLDAVFDATYTMFFITDEALWPDDVSKGWYEAYPNVTGTCSFTLAAVIYDTDQDLNPLFSSDGDGVTSHTNGCVGVHHGLVATDLDPNTNKPVFSGSADAVKCFGNAASFNTLFNHVPGMNEVQCYDMPFRHYGNDTRWGFDSDSTHYTNEGEEKLTCPGNKNSTTCQIGGFSPLEHFGDNFNTAGDWLSGTVAEVNLVSLDGGAPQPLTGARKKRKAAGPVPVLGSVFPMSAAGVGRIEKFDYYCNTPGWTGGVDCEYQFENGENPSDFWCWGNYCDPTFNRWGEGADWSGPTIMRNQQFCFESHATFTYNESQEFTFRGDDDIWVFINRKIAVDNGGAHLAAPGHVVLKNLNKTYTPTCTGADCFLVPGQDYPIDIFFCDRRTTMSNVIIKTNMYIKQSTGLDFTTQENSGGLQLNICVEKTGGSDCASVALGAAGSSQTVTRECGGDISVPIKYSITTRKGEIPDRCGDCAELPYGPTAGINGVVHGGINLYNPKVPVVYPDKITGLAPGSYRLVIEVEGKKTHYNFRVKGNLGIVNKDVVFENVDNEASVYNKNTKWTFIDKAMAGTRIPVYISAPDDYGGVDLISAADQSYTISITAGANLYKSNDPNNPDYNTPLGATYSATVNSTGIDTLWVEVPLAGLATATHEVTASVGSTSAKLTFYAPTITFAEPATFDSLGNPLTWNPVHQDPDKDEFGEDFYRWVGMDVDFYLVAMNPITNGLCTECTFAIEMTASSPGISSEVGAFDQGVAIVRFRSSIQYDTTAASILVTALDNPSIGAPYDNLHFFKPPVPTPVLVDLFDVKGAPIGEMNIPGDFHDPNEEYLDGRADSMVIVYNEPFHGADSIPTYICLNFDESNLKKIDPYSMGISNDPKDKEMSCSAQFDSNKVRIAYNNRPNDSTLVFAVEVDSSFTKDPKTSVNLTNKIATFAAFKRKGKESLTFFEKGLSDRMAPVIISARVKTEEKYPEYDQMKIIISEPVSVLEAAYGVQAFTYFLNSAVDIKEIADRYRNVVAENAPTNKKDTLIIRYNNSVLTNPTPHVGDYIRFRTDQLLWTDTADVNAGAAFRTPEDANFHWNSPVGRGDATGRLPTPWVQVVGDAKINVTTIPFNYADPAAVTDSTPVGEVFPVKTNQNIDDIKAEHPGTLGHFVQSDMGSIIGSDEAYANLDKGEIYFAYSVDYYTNLGNYVAHQDGKIKCNDKFFSPDPKTTPDGMGDCVRYPRNFYVAWNMLSDKHRLVGTGAYITKYTSFVKLGNMGKKAKKEKTEVWGVKRGTGKVAQ